MAPANVKDLRITSFISPSAACSLFEIVVKLFNKAELKCSKVVVLDEAHKVSSAASYLGVLLIAARGLAVSEYGGYRQHGRIEEIDREAVEFDEAAEAFGDAGDHLYVRHPDQSLATRSANLRCVYSQEPTVVPSR